MKIRAMSLCVVAIVLAGCARPYRYEAPVSEPAMRHLYPVMNDGRFGFIDRDGGKKLFLTAPGGELSGTYSEGFALFRNNNKWGYVDEWGRTAILARFDEAGPFSGGRARVVLDGRPGIIDREGNITFHAGFGHLPMAYCFAEGLSPIVFNDLFGFIDAAGTTVIRPQYEDARCFSEGLAAVRISRRWGFIDRKGNLVIDARYDDAGFFSQGTAPVRTGGKYGYIDVQGTMVISPRYDWADSAEGGLARTELNSKYGFIDTRGNEVIPHKFDFLFPFSEGLAAASLNHKWGWIDSTGVFVIPPEFDLAGPFRNGLAQAWIISRWGDEWAYVNKEGKLVWAPDRDE